MAKAISADTKIRELGTLNDLTEKQRKMVWRLVDDWYNNTELWDLLRISGIDEMTIGEIDKLIKQKERKK